MGVAGVTRGNDGVCGSVTALESQTPPRDGSMLPGATPDTDARVATVRGWTVFLLACAEASTDGMCTKVAVGAVGIRIMGSRTIVDAADGRASSGVYDAMCVASCVYALLPLGPAVECVRSKHPLHST